MANSLLSVPTRFRAYQLGTKGSSFSYFAGGHFTLIEGRLTETSKKCLAAEMEICGKAEIDTLHITSWDSDHCNDGELNEILNALHPRRIEYPGYPPHTETAKLSLARVIAYGKSQRAAQIGASVQKIDPPFINSLNEAENLGYKNMFLHPRRLVENSNDNSSVKLFRKGMFNVASLGDVEDGTIGSMLRRGRIFSSEVDVLILAHHGSKCDVNSKTFFKAVQPTVAICSSDYDNQYEHPDPSVSQSLYELGIRKFTTKTGDIIVESLPGHFKNFRVTNLIADSSKASSSYEYVSKKFRLLNTNMDTLRNRTHPGFKGLR